MSVEIKKMPENQITKVESPEQDILSAFKRKRTNKLNLETLTTIGMTSYMNINSSDRRFSKDEVIITKTIGIIGKLVDDNVLIEDRDESGKIWFSVVKVGKSELQ